MSTQPARVTLAEIIAEGSLPADANTLLTQTLDAIDAIASGLNGALGALEGGVAEQLAGQAALIDALQTRPQTQVSAAGINISALDDVKARLASARERGAMSGETAYMFEGLIAALGAAAPPPAPAKATPEPAPVAPAPVVEAPVETPLTSATEAESTPASTPTESAPETGMEPQPANAGDEATFTDAATSEQNPGGAGGA